MSKNTGKVKIALATLVLGTLAATAHGLNLTKKEYKDADVVLNSRNSLSLRGEVSDESVSKVIKQLRQLDTDREAGKPVYLVLYTPGGSVQAGLELFEAAKGLRRPVKTITIFAASMGFQAAQSLEERLILESGVLMSHKAAGGHTGEFDSGNESQLDNRIGLWKQRVKDLDLKTVERTKGKQTLQSYMKAYENELWLTGKQAVEGGYADRIVTVRCDGTLNASEEQVFGSPGMEVRVKFSRCPLQTGPEEVEMHIKTNRGVMPIEEFTSKGGLLGVECAVAASRVTPTAEGVLCAVDANLTREKIEQERQKIQRSYSAAGMRSGIVTRF